MTPLGAQPILEAVIPARALKTLVIHEDTEVHGDTLMQILKQRPTLEEVRIHKIGAGCSSGKHYDADFPNLRILEFRGVYCSFSSYHLVSTSF
jgi:hypothetical protein